MDNLDVMDPEALMGFWMAHRGGRNYKTLGFSGRGAKRAASDLACYASNKATAMNCRLRGEINTALLYEGICDSIYDNLPEFAKW